MSDQGVLTSKIKLLGNRILAKRAKALETVKGGIILPDTAKEKPEQATVVAVGTGSKNKEGNLIPITDISVGDTILMEKYANAQTVSVDDEEFVIVNVDSIVAILE